VRFEQMLVNLLNNARQIHRSGPAALRLLLRARPLCGDTRADNGIGIEQEKLAGVFGRLASAAPCFARRAGLVIGSLW